MKALTFLLTLLMAVSPRNLLANTVTIDGITWTYTVSNGEVSIGGGSYSSTAISTITTGPIVIPSTLGGYPVRSIGDYAFYYCSSYYCSSLTSVTLPDGVKSIGNAAFWGCSELTAVTIPNSVTNIGFWAFNDCPKLTSITIPDSMTNIGYCAFYGCSGLSSVTIPNGVTSIGDYAFYGCSNLTSVTIPNGVTSIGSLAFKGCSGLTSVTIPNSVTSIGSGAFDGCSGLYNLTTIPGVRLVDGWAIGYESSLSGDLDLTGCRGIGDYSFSDCSGLTSLSIGNSVKSVGQSAFRNCSGLVSVTIGDGVKSIGADAFLGCTGITTVNVSSMDVWLRITFKGGFAHPLYYGKLYVNGERVSSLTVPGDIVSIGDWTFCYNDDISSIQFHDAVTNIGKRAFSCCDNLKSVRLPPNVKIIEDHVFWGCGLESIDIPYGVISIGDDAFDSSDLLSVSIPGSVTNIGNNAFRSCAKLKSLVIPDSVQRIGTKALFNCISLEEVFLPSRFSAYSFGIPQSCRIVFYDDLLTLMACNNNSGPVSWGNDSGWMVFPDTTTEDGFSLRSREIGASTNSAIEASISGKGTLSFRWKISAGRGDSCKFYLDGTETNSIATRNGAMTDWTTVTLDLPAGPHALRWSYERGSGDAAGEDAAFLDDVDWRPEVSLFVASAWGAATPEAGAHGLVYGDEVAASVAEPAAADGTRRVCVGWTGTGSVPADGVGTNVAFRIEKDSTLAWNWRTDHWIDLAVSGGTADFEPKWVEAGTEVVAKIVPATHLCAISLAGDTNGVSLAGTTLTISVDGPREIAVTVEEVKVSLAVESERGVPSPTNGVHALSWGTEVSASVAEPEPVDGVRYVCTGWTGTGSVPDSGDGTNVAFRIEEASSIRWNWRTNVWIALSTSGPVSADFAEAWTNIGEMVVAGWTPSVPYFTVALSGDADGVTLDEAARTISIPADRPRNVALSVTELTLAGALDAPGLVWTTDGDAVWFPQVATSADGEDAARSGSVLGSQASTIQTTLEGSGTFSWTWRLDSATGGNAGVDVLLDGSWKSLYAPGADWSAETLAIVGEGPHTVRFEFWNAGTEATAGDCAYLDQVSWTGEVPGGRKIVVEGVKIPFAWIETNAPAALAAAGGDYEAAAKADASNGENKVWECYVAGLSPTNAAERFLAIVNTTNGTIAVNWTPDLNEGGTKNLRVYTVEGKTNLVDRSWGVTNEATRFFRVKVSMPEE